MADIDSQLSKETEMLTDTEELAVTDEGSYNALEDEVE
jgi:hypothetical protein